jgi:hypothetical protein
MDRTNTFYDSDAFMGYGSQLMMGDDASPINYEAIALVKRIQFGDQTTAALDVTHLRSRNAHREKIAGLRDSGPFQVTCTYSPAEQSHTNAGGGSGPFAAGGLLFVARERTIKNWKLVLSDDDDTELPFRGFISKYQLGEVSADQSVDLMLEFMPASDYSEDLP